MTLARINDLHRVNRVVSPMADVSQHAVIGTPAESRDKPSLHAAMIHAGACVREFVRVHAGTERPTVVGKDTLLMSGVHVGHDAVIGQRCELAPNAVVGGHVTIGDDVRVGMGAVIRPRVTIGDGARIGMGAVVTRDVPAGEVWYGNPAAERGIQWP